MGGKELLAPAGDLEAGYAALYYGADAVYLGLQQFSARAPAANFDEPALNEFAGYAHSLGRKVFVALNTLLQECELSDLLKQLDICVRCKADALIIQDLGVARVVGNAIRSWKCTPVHKWRCIIKKVRSLCKSWDLNGLFWPES